MNQRLIVIDISSFIFRAYYAIRLLHSPDGVPVNAVHGVLSMLLKLFANYQPSHVLVARDSKGPSFRHKIYPEYKANRSEPPEDLIPQFDLIRELLEKMELPHLRLDGYEADDLIGSACTQWQDQFEQILIASGDKDLMQFVSDKVKVLDTMKDKIYDREGVFEKMGVWPEQIVDYLSMLGDSSDNIPGMKGIGAKGAAQLLATHQTLEECIKNADSMTNKRVKNAFANHVDDAHLSKELIAIPTDLKLDCSPKETKFEFYPSNNLISFLKGLGFKTSLKKIEEIKYTKDHEDPNPSGEQSLEVIEEDRTKHYKLVAPQKFDQFFKQLQKKKIVSVEASFSSKGYFHPLLSLAISFDGKKAHYLPFSHSGDEDILGENVPNLLAKQEEKILLELVSNDKKNLIGNHLKKLFAHCCFKDIPIKCQHYDNLVANYISSSAPRSNTQALAEHFLQYEVAYQEEKNDDPSEYPLNRLLEMACEKVVLNYQLKSHQEKELEKKAVEHIYTDIENPLTPILASMEANGVQLNQGYLSHLEEQYSCMLKEIQDKIERESGEKINLNSPKQVSELLFEKLQLPVIKKIKTGFSTDVEVLTELDSRDLSPVPGLIIQYRELEKLLSTYIRVLPQLVHPKSERLHTHFNQMVAATGRLSSDRPNLQNIPIRTEYGRKIRKAFMAKPGALLLSADYSQVELRLLAHLSSDSIMVKAFKNDEDIHAQTASEVTGIDIDQITQEERSRAKAVNFGLMYGQSSFGLAKALRISRKEAKDYITGYFERFSRIKSYLDKLKDECAQTGYAQTLYGRKRFLPDIHSQNRTVRSNAERMAINSPIQGAAADIIKLAMIAIYQAMDERQLKSKMILQVHDELIFEVEESELEEMKKLVSHSMESVVKLKVPLRVDIGMGVNWFDLK